MDWITRRKIDNIWGPIGTLIVHVIVIIVVANFMVAARQQEAVEVEVVIKEIETFEDLEDIEQELDELEDIPTVVEAVAPPEVSVDQAPPPIDSVTPAAAADVDLSALDMMEAVSPLKFKGLYAGRSSAGRAEAIGKYGGGMGERTEYAVKKALEWLRDHQYPDGSWGPEYRVAMTGLALLALFAHGETTSSPEFGMAVKKGLQYLLKSQKGGWFIGGGRGIGVRNKVYEHVIGTYAMSEAYGLTQIPFLRYPMEDAVQVMIDGQHEAGGWDYNYVMGPDAHIDVSLSGWHIQALKAALVSGAGNRGLKTAMDAGIQSMKAAYQRQTGMFQYGTREPLEPGYPMTGVAVLSMQLAGHALDAEARAGTDVLKNTRFRWARGTGETARQMGGWPVYSWYYITQARFHQGGRSWVEWNKEFAPICCAMQNEDGSWCPPPDCAEAPYGPVYSTALITLMLEVYYRFLPTYQPIETERIAPIEQQIKEDEDIVIEFG